MAIITKINENDIDCVPLRGGCYQNWIAWKTKKNNHVLIVQYVPFSFIYYVFIAIIISSPFFLPPLIENQKLWLFCKIAVMTCSFVFLVIGFFYNQVHSQKGDWLIFEKESNKIKLPRNGVEISKEKLVCMQIITGAPDFSDSLLDIELNIVALNEDEYKRYPLMRALTARMLWSIALELSEQLSCPCQVVEYGINRKCRKKWLKSEDSYQ